MKRVFAIALAAALLCGVLLTLFACTGEAEIIEPSVGETIEFGGITWLVLEVQDGRALLLSEHLIIEGHAYHWTFTEITWEHSDIRAWLNKEFLDRFSAEDRARIAQTTVVNNNNPWVDTPGGNDTTDYIFLLSLEEVVRYFGDSGQLHNRPNQDIWLIDDQYNNARFTRDAEGMTRFWWLRSPGGDPDSAAGVTDGGPVHLGGDRVDRNNGIRPALWLYL